jgi:hypothetical protein
MQLSCTSQLGLRTVGRIGAVFDIMCQDCHMSPTKATLLGRSRGRRLGWKYEQKLITPSEHRHFDPTARTTLRGGRPGATIQQGLARPYDIKP